MRRLLVVCWIMISCSVGAGKGVAGEAATAVFPSIDGLLTEFQSDKTVLTFRIEGRAGADADAIPPTPVPRLIALPPDARNVEILHTTSGQAHGQPCSFRMARLRGQTVAILTTTPDRFGIGDHRLEVRYSGAWPAQVSRATRHARGIAATAQRQLVGLPAAQDASMNGSYVIITTAEYASAVQDLAAWKRRKGFVVVVATTSETGTTTTAIKDWLQVAYDTWEVPPEYVLLVGDVEDVPPWYLSGNVTDHPYTLLDGDDWLPDVMLGRLPGESVADVATMVAKSVSYERTPAVDLGNEWQARSLMVAGNLGSTTPIQTVTFCGEQLESIGFDPATAVFSPPNPPQIGPQLITPPLEQGVSWVAYRGWANGPAGWESPYFLIEHVLAVQNGGRMPVILDFVCWNGRFDDDSPCFGEAWLRLGTPEDIRGAVGFVGGAEPWSHTRYNDALAVAFFERIVDPAVSDLGRLVTAGKLRFIDYFPHELDFDVYGEESVEYYFHIYNLFGDPELNAWRAAATAMTVAHPAQLAAAANVVDVTVTEADGVTPLANARVGLVQADQLSGCGFSDGNGVAHVALADLAAGGPLALTVTHPDRIPYEADILVNDSDPFLVFTHLIVDDSAGGNGDGQLNPAETADLWVTVNNGGSENATSVTAELFGDEYATVTPGDIVFPDVPGGAFATALAPFQVQLAPAAEDGQRIRCRLEVTHGLPGDEQVDASDLWLPVAAPRWLPAEVDVSGGGPVEPDEIVVMVVALTNQGSVATAGATATLALETPGLAEIMAGTASYGSAAPGDTVSNAGEPFVVRIGETIALGTPIVFRVDLVNAEGAESWTSFALTVGDLDAGAPVGPDGYGYYAYDSSDQEYPDQRPDFAWVEISPAYGGNGLLLLDGHGQHPHSAVIALPFTFMFYGQEYSQLRVYRNGLVAFDTAEYLEFYNWPIPSEHGSGAVIAPFWDNLFASEEYGQDGVYYLYDPITDAVIIEWSRLHHFREEVEGLQTFQLKLLDPGTYPTPTGDGEIVFQYLDIANNDQVRNYATVGIEAPSEQDGLQLSYAGEYSLGSAPLTSGLAVKLTTETPVYEAVTTVGPGDDPPELPAAFHLAQNYPNPFNPRTTLSFTLPQAEHVHLGIYDLHGHLVRRLWDGPSAAGRSQIVWDGRNSAGEESPAGVYFYRLRTTSVRAMRKMMLIR